MAEAKRDQNRVTTLLAVSSADGVTPVTVYADPITHRLLTDGSGGGGLTPTTGQYKSFLTVGDVDADYVTGDYSDDIGLAIAAAYAALPSWGGRIYIKTSTLTNYYDQDTAVVFGTNGKIVSLVGENAGSTFIRFTPTSGRAFTFDTGNPTAHLVYEVSGITFMGSPALIAAAQTNTRTSIGIYLGGSNGCPGIHVHDCIINGFGTQLEIGANAYMLTFTATGFSGGNGVNGTGTGLQGSLVHINTASNSGERNVFNACNFTDPGNSAAGNAIYFELGSIATTFFTNCSFDNVQLRALGSNGMIVIENAHVEDAAFATYGQYIPFYFDSASSNYVIFSGLMIADSSNNSSNNFDVIIMHGVNLRVDGWHLENYGGQTVTYLADHSLNNGSSSEYITGGSVQSGGLTWIARNWAYTVAKAVGFCQTYANSYPFGIVTNSNNTVDFVVGNNNKGLILTENGDATLLRDVSITRNLAVTGTIIGSSTIAGTAITASSTLTTATTITTGTNGATGGQITLNGSTSGSGVIRVAATAGAGIVFQLPSSNGSSGDVLQTNGAGVTSWVTGGGSGANTALSNLASVAINTTLLPASNDTIALGSTTLNFSDIFLATGAVINYNNGNVTLTHASGKLTLGGSPFEIQKSATGALGPELRLNNNADTAGDQFAITAYNSASGTPYRGALLWTGSSVGQAKLSIFSGNSATLSGMAEQVTITAADVGTRMGIGVTSPTAALHLKAVSTAASSAPIKFTSGTVMTTPEAGVFEFTNSETGLTFTAVATRRQVVLDTATQTLTNKTLTSPTINTANIGGITQLAEGASIALDAAGSADGAYSGITIAGTAGATLAFGDLIYLAVADSRWELADADAATTADRMLGMCVLAAASDGSATRVLLMGNIRADAAFPALTIGAPVYVGETAGDVQVAIPTGADNVIRRVGFALTADELYFNPSMDSQITVA